MSPAECDDAAPVTISDGAARCLQPGWSRCQRPGRLGSSWKLPVLRPAIAVQQGLPSVWGVPGFGRHAHWMHDRRPHAWSRTPATLRAVGVP